MSMALVLGKTDTAFEISRMADADNGKHHAHQSNHGDAWEHDVWNEPFNFANDQILWKQYAVPYALI